jgi:hypothetical protein
VPKRKQGSVEKQRSTARLLLSYRRRRHSISIELQITNSFNNIHEMPPEAFLPLGRPWLGTYPL